MTDNNSISEKQQMAIMSLMTQPSVRAAARDCGVVEGTLYRWLQQPEFALEYKMATQKIVDDCIERQKIACRLAVDTLIEVMEDADAPASSRVSAAEYILNRCLGRPTERIEAKNILTSVHLFMPQSRDVIEGEIVPEALPPGRKDNND